MKVKEYKKLLDSENKQNYFKLRFKVRRLEDGCNA